MDVKNIKGIGDKKAEILNKTGILDDILSFYPYKYSNRTIFKTIKDAPDDIEVCIIAAVASTIKTFYPKPKLSISSCRIIDNTGVLKCVFYNNKYINSSLKEGETYTFFGQVSGDTIINPKFSRGVSAPEIIPIYKTIKGITNNDIRKIISTSLNTQTPDEFLPEDIIKENNLLNIKDCIYKIHNPKNMSEIRQAQNRLNFQKYFIYSLAINNLKNRRTTNCIINNFDYSELSLPFQLTNSQQDALSDCIAGLKTHKPLNRLIQGDVGCGKTIIAIILSYIFMQNNFQTAIMVPTEILARQHMFSFKELLDSDIVLLVSSLKASEKRLALEKIKNGTAKIIIGTTAIISDDIIYNNLGLIIFDEQHKFGVNQRAKLIEKGNNPHILVMSATPIPRTLSLAIYGDLDISIINELPPNRIPIKTYLVDESRRVRIQNFISKICSEGRQGYIVCPLIESDEYNDDGRKEVVSYTNNLKKKLPHLNITFIHGSMKDAQKNIIMNDFLDKKIDILVSTTVIEVGINNPNANLMIIENAELFGLSTLHQLRGRVGRSIYESYCILFSGKNSERLKILKNTSDGFELAGQDLKLRGGGEFFGTRQHGIQEILDLDTFNAAKNALENIKNLDDYPLLKSKVFKLLNDKEIFN